MIQFSNVSKSFGEQVLLQDVTFTVNPGERIGLVGRNGHGKTTLFRMILGEEHPDSGAISIPKSYSIGHLSQHIRFTKDTVLDEACLCLKPAEDGADNSYEAKTILMGLGFSLEDFSRSPLDLSGGYQVRLNLAKVLVSEPNLLLLDEPTNYLDILSIRWLRQFLRSWKRELILITHDRDFMDSVSTHTMGIHRSRIRKIVGTTFKLYEQIMEEEEIHEKTRINDERKRDEIEQFIRRFRAKATKARAVQSRVKALGKTERLERLSEIRNLDFEFNAAPFTGKRLLEVRDLSFSFGPASPPLIQDLTFTVGKGDRIAVIGKNGRGKTTLLSLLSGGLSATSGTISRHEQLRIGYFGQTNIDRLEPGKTVEEEIMDVHPERSRRAARSICGAMMFEGDAALKKVSVLSGGEKSRVLLGKLLVSPANLLLLDEPTNHLDMESIDSLIEAVDAFPGAVVIVTHSEMILHSFAERLVVFDEGVRIFEGGYQDFLDRVGWGSEAAESRDGARSGGNGGMSRRDMRKLRAEVITDRSRTLGPIQQRIEEVEASIIAIEEEVTRDNKALIAASVAGNGDEIRRLSKALPLAQERTDRLFAELEDLTGLLKEKTRKFEEKLSDLDSAHIRG